MTHLKRRHGTHTIHCSDTNRLLWLCDGAWYIFIFSSLSPLCFVLYTLRVLCTMYLIKSSLLRYVYLDDDDDACIHIIIIINVIIIVVPHFTTTHKIYMSNIYFVRGDLMLVLIYCAHVPLCVGVLFVYGVYTGVYCNNKKNNNNANSKNKFWCRKREKWMNEWTTRCWMVVIRDCVCVCVFTCVCKCAQWESFQLSLII